MFHKGKIFSFFCLIVTISTHPVWSMWDRLEEGWRRRTHLTVRYDPGNPNADPILFDFTSVHETMAARERTIWDSLSSNEQAKNGALFGISVIAQDRDKQWRVFTSERSPALEGTENQGGSGSSNLPQMSLDLSTILQHRTSEESTPLDLYFMSGEGSGQAQTHIDFPTHLSLEDKTQAIIVQANARSKKPALMQDEIEVEFLNDMSNSFLQFSQAHKNFLDDYNSLGRLVQDCADCEHRIANIPNNPSDIGTLKKYTQDITEALEKLGPYNDSERLILRYLNYSRTQEKLGSIFKRLIEQGNTIHVMLFHLHSRLDPCDRCACCLFRTFERLTGFVAHLQEMIKANQKEVSPLMSLLVSSRTPHQKRKQKFSGEDGEEEQVIRLEAFVPFYPLLQLHNPSLTGIHVASPEYLKRERWESRLKTLGGLLFDQGVRELFAVTCAFAEEKEQLKTEHRILREVVEGARRDQEALREENEMLQEENQSLTAYIMPQIAELVERAYMDIQAFRVAIGI